MASYEYDSQNEELHRIAGGTLYADAPIGSYIPFGGTVIPTGWLLCNGQAVSRTDYADLFKVIGTAYGNGDGSTTFNIPDLREAVPKGAGLTSKSNNHINENGLAVGEFIDDRLQTHQHNYVHPYRGSQFPLQSASSPTNGGTELLTGDNNGRTGATTEVKAVGSNYIIKAKQIGVPADFASAVERLIATQTSTTGFNTSLGSGVCNSFKMGNLVIVSIVCNSTTNPIPSGTAIATIPQEFRPSSTKTASVGTIRFNNITFPSANAVSMGTNGQVTQQITGEVPVGADFDILFVYSV